MSRVLLFLTIIIWPFGSLLSYQNNINSLRIYYLDIFVAILFATVLANVAQYKECFKTNLFKAYRIFIVALILSLVVNPHTTNASAVLYLIRVIVYPSLYLVASQIKQSELKKVVILSLVIFAFLGVLQYLFFPDLRILKNLGFDDHYFRLVGSFLDPNYTGAILSASSLYLIFSGYLSWSLLLVIPLALTFSRASYLSFIIPLVFGYLNKKNYNLKLLIFIPLLAVLIYLIPKPFGEGVNLFRTFSIFSRLQSWQEGLSLFFDKPVFGWGYNNLTGHVAIDNSFILVLATSGLVGLLGFLNLIKEVIWSSALPSKIFIFSILIHSLFNNSFFFIWIMSSFWIVSSIKTRE